MDPIKNAVNIPGSTTKQKETSMKTCVLWPHSSAVRPMTKSDTGTTTYQITTGQISSSRNVHFPRNNPATAATNAVNPEQNTPPNMPPINKCRSARTTVMPQPITKLRLRQVNAAVTVSVNVPAEWLPRLQILIEPLESDSNVLREPEVDYGPSATQRALTRLQTAMERDAELARWFVKTVGLVLGD